MLSSFLTIFRFSKATRLSVQHSDNTYWDCQDFLWFRGYRYKTQEEEDRRQAIFNEFLETLAPR